ncbi:hypothetical protein [Psychromonas sp. Urea-02u-13]|uniref:hypothetical protein n=1 Tax=Psychromonas sp. Urea-02u-13 TaxID=2058326 RepID=UPI000C31D93F|nr:hypothetical protein [Psychromonas sp. Urea-02u-13]PKG38734.1 hypothetical protein CXF74_12365 [Psychromonas sp. Urea-02u-13]
MPSWLIAFDLNEQKIITTKKTSEILVVSFCFTFAFFVVGVFQGGLIAFDLDLDLDLVLADSRQLKTNN